MRVSDFHFDLPEELIAQHPPVERGSSRMLVLDRAVPGDQPGALRDEMFQSLPRMLRRGDLLILNDSRVLPARLFATRGGLTTQANSPQPSGAIEVLLTAEVEGSENPISQKRGVGHPILWKALVKPAKKVRCGEKLNFCETNAGTGGTEPVLTAEVVAAGEFGERTLRFGPVEDFYERVARIGHMPLPPYIRRDQSGQPDTPEDRERYQTVYSDQPGSAAAPTAGLHFTPEILAELEARGVEIRYITLHVGLGTFQPVRVERLEEIRLHAERYTLPAATAEALNRALAEGRRVVAVGTTTTRTLEHIGAQWAAVNATPEGVPQGRPGVETPGYQPHSKRAVDGTGEPVPLSKTSSAAACEPVPSSETGSAARGEPVPLTETDSAAKFEPHSGSTSIFLSPGHKFRVVSGLLTNFHLPKSTLLMLVSAFAAGDGEPDQGRRAVLAAYAHAIRERYRFYSYGDCMLLL